MTLRPQLQAILGDLVTHPKVQETRHHLHHNVPKHDHLMRSAHWSYRIAGLLKADRRVCARAAILHDLDSRNGNWATHGWIAANVAADIGESTLVCRAIVPHMFPLGPAPKSREGWVLVIADKLASLADMGDFVAGLLSGRSLRRRNKLRESDPYYRGNRRHRPAIA